MVKTIGKILVFIGRPFFFLLSSLILVSVLGLASIGRFIRIFFKFVLKPRKIKFKKFKLPKSKFPRVKLPKIKIKPAITFVLLFLSFSFLTFYFLILKGLPSPENLTEREIEVSTKIYDRNGNLLYKIYKDKNRTVVTLDKIPQSVQLATLAIEDAEFYTHPGISVRGISRAFFQNLRTGTLQGGSTITQQLVKNALLNSERTLSRKIKELVLSFQVEYYFTKDEILEMYLNEVSYGGTAYGIAEASNEYFGKPLESLNLAEAAFLAGLPQSPTKYSPFGSDPSVAFVRQREVLHLMVINRFITKEQEEEALNTRITFKANITNIKAPHFVMYIRQLLVDKYGEEMVEKGGLEVTTSLDLSIQELAEKVVKEEVEKLKNLKVGNGAALVVNPKSGEILAMVGSKDYFDVTNDGNVNVTTRLRQPGSSIKVINYAYALSKAGYSPASLVDDSPITFITPGTNPYSPKNYDGEFKGKISVRRALAESRNIPAVRILASYGVTKMIELGRLMGITSWEDPRNYGLSLTLGGGEVKLIDLARVYATIANYGKVPEISPILDVKDYKQSLASFAGKGDSKITNQVIDERVAYMLIDILKDNNARAEEFGTNSALVVRNHPEVAVKTGTSNDLRDNLTAGFNQDYLVVTWVGNNDNSPMARIASGITGASPIWNKIMTALLSSKPSIDWTIPNGIVKINCLGKSEIFKKEDTKNISSFCQPPTLDTKDNKEVKRAPQIL